MTSGKELRLYQQATRVNRVLATGQAGYMGMQNVIRDILGLLGKRQAVSDKDDYANFLFAKKPELMELVGEVSANYILRVVKESVMIHKGNIEFGFEKTFGDDAVVVIPEQFWNESAMEVLTATNRLKSGVEKLLDATTDPEKADAVKEGWRDMIGTRMRNEAWKAQAATAKRVQSYAGVKSYIWNTRKDERVVGNPMGLYPVGSADHGDHWSRQGQVFSWGDPPHDGHPGEAFGCRCEAVPMLSLNNPELV